MLRTLVKLNKKDGHLMAVERALIRPSSGQMLLAEHFRLSKLVNGQDLAGFVPGADCKDRSGEHRDCKRGRRRLERNEAYGGPGEVRECNEHDGCASIDFIAVRLYGYNSPMKGGWSQES